MNLKPNHSDTVYNARQLDGVSDDYRVALQPDEALAFVELDREGWNRYKPNNVIQFIHKIDSIIPRNGNKFNYYFYVGSNSSREITLMVRGDVLSEEIFKQIRSLEPILRADDINYNEKTFYYEFRYWWD